jgi:type II restriction enzyme
MAEKHRLRLNRAGTVINLTSIQQETALGKALKATSARLLKDFGLDLIHKKRWPLPEIVDQLREDFPEVDFYDPSPRASMNPDGGVLSLRNAAGKEFPVLISEVKNQGTNDLRALEGKKPQAKGNAIERLGKNVIGIRAAMLGEGISILDRVATIAMFGKLNEINVVSQDPFNRGSFFFRAAEWDEEEMAEIMIEIGTRSIHYYLAKYGDEEFVPAESSPLPR